MERITLTRYPEMTIEQARRKTAEIIGKIAEGNNPGEARRAIRTEPTFRELFAEYGERHGKNKLTWATDLQRYRDYLDRPLGAHKVGSVTSPMITRVLSDMEKANKANATINNVRALASSIFAKGIEWGRLSANPVSATKTRKTLSRDRFLQTSELPRFFVSLRDEPNEAIRDFFLVSLLTGARRSNVLSMRWSEVSITDRVWRIARTKNGLPQNVTLSDDVLQVLKQRKRSAELRAEFVFPGDGESGHLVEPKKGWRRIFDRDELTQLRALIAEAGGSFELKRRTENGDEIHDALEVSLDKARAMATALGLPTEGLRIPDLRIHDLRRTLGSWQAISGSSLLVIGKSLNHKSQQSTAIYARLDLDPVRASVEKATGAMLAAAGIESLVQDDANE